MSYFILSVEALRLLLELKATNNEIFFQVVVLWVVTPCSATSIFTLKM